MKLFPYRSTVARAPTGTIHSSNNNETPRIENDSGNGSIPKVESSTAYRVAALRYHEQPSSKVQAQPGKIPAHEADTRTASQDLWVIERFLVL